MRTLQLQLSPRRQVLPHPDLRAELVALNYLELLVEVKPEKLEPATVCWHISNGSTRSRRRMMNPCGVVARASGA